MARRRRLRIRGRCCCVILLLGAGWFVMLGGTLTALAASMRSPGNRMETGTAPGTPSTQMKSFRHSHQKCSHQHSHPSRASRRRNHQHQQAPRNNHLRPACEQNPLRYMHHLICWQARSLFDRSAHSLFSSIHLENVGMLAHDSYELICLCR